MTKTELMLLAVHRSPLVPLADVCDQYFGVGYEVARARAALNRLPIPAWRMGDSQKAPLMVRLADLAACIDNLADAALDSHEHSQI